ncbi:MAG TPA: DnaJ domain-containing protein [Polyangiaceae bacterium LLY-WYZ-15_(1-7)]|nr:hypothetical protein [Sandaracinus sp.]HJL03342.1 DnaJ domain-containing protein [Polyangiaceae bacterium LLY-WYZ-15_(1-7)]MBJ74050.1 hypothetical protein [Sandaracinus sp.]HJL10639.1 DnaJ domain-containing protein [Polyangiaceae bacterium LLY-WYZ-15_(1-7)]HJL32698.1 DnaJ domain-containing protein [Polyangiaceae bacterium LLY-WYZ-15_(1-7)]
MSDRLDQLDYYTLLGLEPSATADQIRAAFHTFALKFHPDNHSGEDPAKAARAAQIFRRGAEAYRILSEPQTRKRYDEGLQQGKLRLAAEEQGPRKRRPGSGSQKVSRKAHPFVRKADLAIKREDWNTAKLNLKIALGHDPESDIIQAKIALVEEKIAARKRR